MTRAPNTFPGARKDVTWKRFAEQVMDEFNSDDLATRKRFVAKELEVVHRMHRAGIPFLAGTDTPCGVYIFPGFSLHRELPRLVAAGFTPMAALQTATLNPAKFLGKETELGTIEKGKLADLALLDRNPLDNIQNADDCRGDRERPVSVARGAGQAAGGRGGGGQQQVNRNGCKIAG